MRTLVSIHKKKILRFICRDKNPTIILIQLRDPDRLEYIRNILRDIKEKIAEYTHIIFFNLAVPVQFKELEYDYYCIGDYLQDNDYKDIDTFIYPILVKNWYRQGEDATRRFNDLYLGNLVEYDFRIFLVPRIKNIALITKLINKYNFNKVVIIEEAEEIIDAAKIFKDNFKISIYALRLNDRLRISGFLKVFKTIFSQTVSKILDLIVKQFLLFGNNSEEAILVDDKIIDLFHNSMRSFKCIPILTDYSLKSRIGILLHRQIYVPMCNHYIFRISGYKRRARSNFTRDIKIREQFKYKDIYLWDLLKDKLHNYFYKVFPSIKENIRFLNRLCDRRFIKLAVLRNDARELEKTIATVFKKRNIPSLVIQHGILAEDDGIAELFCDTYAVWGTALIQWFKAHTSVPANLGRITVVGNPKFDRLWDKNIQITDNRIYKKLGLYSNKKTIILITQKITRLSSYLTDDIFTILSEEMYNLMKKWNNRQLIVKVDPYEDPTSYYKLMVKKQLNNVVVTRDIDICSLLPICDLVIGFDSTVIFEAMWFDKPTISVNLTQRKDRIPYAQKNAAIGIYKLEDLKPAIEHLLSDHQIRERLRLAQKNFIAEYSFQSEKGARANIVELAQQIANR